MNIYCYPELSETAPPMTSYGVRLHNHIGSLREIARKYVRSAYSAEDFAYIRRDMEAMMAVYPDWVDTRYEASPSNQRQLLGWVKKLDGPLAGMVLADREF